MGKITQNLNFHLDGNGNGEVSYSRWMAGVSISAKAKITSPEGNYHIVLYVNGKQQLASDIATGQEISAKFGTSFWTSTTIKVTIHSDNVRNQQGTISLDASY